jgi:FkbM family methyltransferase
VSWKSAFTTVFIERRVPWRVEQWLSRRATVRAYRERRMARWDRALYGRYIRPGDLVFDVGANRGDKADSFSRLGAAVIAIEPDASTAAALQRRFAREANVHVVAAGVGAVPGEAVFHPSPDSTRSTFTVDRMRQLGDDVPFGSGVTVPITTLDALVATYGVPRFCKIDVEGYEPEVFQGLNQPLPALSFEFHGELLAEAGRCLDKLDRLRMTRYNVVLHPVQGHWHQRLDRLYFPAEVGRAELMATVTALAGRCQLAGDIWAFAEREQSR